MEQQSTVISSFSKDVSLKPCPFCASTRVIKGERYFAICVDCGATGPERAGKTNESKIANDWNTRPFEQG